MRSLPGNLAILWSKRSGAPCGQQKRLDSICCKTHLTVVATVHFGDFEWDSKKAEANLKKHGVSFPEATTAFLDEHNLIGADTRYEERFILIGMSNKRRVLYVIHGEILDKKHTRIISARVATKREALHYTLEDAP